MYVCCMICMYADARLLIHLYVCEYLSASYFMYLHMSSDFLKYVYDSDYVLLLVCVLRKSVHDACTKVCTCLHLCSILLFAWVGA